jgi:hypothetical protein
LPACYLTGAQVAALKLLAAVEETTYVLVWGAYSGSWSTTSYTVVFDKSSGAAVDMEPLRDDKLRYQIPDSFAAPAIIYTGQINLMRVA